MTTKTSRAVKKVKAMTEDAGVKSGRRIRLGWWPVLGIVVVFSGAVRCSGRGSTNDDGRSSWEFSGTVSAGAKVQGSESGLHPQAPAVR